MRREEFKLVARVRGHEFWAHWDESAGVYEVFAEEEAICYLGVFDTIADIKAWIPQHMEDIEA